MSVRFTKMQACGNDFVIVDDRHQRWAGMESELAVRLCRRRLSIGADGLLLVRAGSAPGRFSMRFMNADGLEGEMCGNGARCLAAFLHREALVGSAFVLETAAGLVPVDLSAMPTIRVSLGQVTPLRRGLTLHFGGEDFAFDEVDVGPPHVVGLLPSVAALASVDLQALGPFVRHHPLFAPRGCNVNLVAQDDAGNLHLRTYERGVEDETLGCGTGAVAAAAVACQRLTGRTSARIITRSTEALAVDLPADGPASLTGSAAFVADGTVDASILRGLQPMADGVHA